MGGSSPNVRRPSEVTACRSPTLSATAPTSAAGTFSAPPKAPASASRAIVTTRSRLCLRLSFSRIGRPPSRSPLPAIWLLFQRRTRSGGGMFSRARAVP